MTDIHTFAQLYSFPVDQSPRYPAGFWQAGVYHPSDHERAMIANAIQCYLDECAIFAETTKESLKRDPLSREEKLHRSISEMAGRVGAEFIPRETDCR